MTAAPGQIVDYEVKDTKQHILSKKDDISRGKFSFTSELFDVYELCFISKVPHSKSKNTLTHTHVKNSTRKLFNAKIDFLQK